MSVTLLFLTKILCTAPSHAILLYDSQMREFSGFFNAIDMDTRHIFFSMAFYRNVLQLWHACAFDSSNKVSRLYTIVFVYIDMFVDAFFVTMYLYDHIEESTTLYAIYHYVILLMSLYIVIFFSPKKSEHYKSPV